METFLIATASFLGGGFLTSLVFIFGWSNKVTKIIDNQDTMVDAIKELKAKLEAHIVLPQSACPMHTSILMDIDRLKHKAEVT